MGLTSGDVEYHALSAHRATRAGGGARVTAVPVTFSVKQLDSRMRVTQSRVILSEGGRSSARSPRPAGPLLVPWCSKNKKKKAYRPPAYRRHDTDPLSHMSVQEQLARQPLDIAPSSWGVRIAQLRSAFWRFS